MATKGKSKRSAASKAADKRAWMPLVWAGCSVAVMGGVGLGAAFGLPALHADASKRLAGQGVLPQIVWPTIEAREGGMGSGSSNSSGASAPGSGSGSAPASTWMAPDHQQALIDVIIESVKRTAAEAGHDPLDARLLSDLCHRLSETGWFEGLPTVRRERTGRVTISGAWRAPAAVVRWQGRDRLIALGGELLPHVYDSSASGYIEITGVRRPPPVRSDGSPALGQQWASEEIRASIQLLRRLQPMPFFAQVRGVEVSGFEGAGASGRLVIITDKGTRVVWGVPVNANGAPLGERPTGEKLATLRHLFEHHGRIDQGLAEINIAAIQPTVRQPTR